MHDYMDVEGRAMPGSVAKGALLLRIHVIFPLSIPNISARDKGIRINRN